MQVEIEVAPEIAVVVDHRPVDIRLRLPTGAGVADRPEVDIAIAADRGVRLQVVALIFGGEPRLAVVDRVVVYRVWIESGEFCFVLESTCRCRVQRRLPSVLVGYRLADLDAGRALVERVHLPTKLDGRIHAL